jgi:hypothetical protein
MAAPTGDKALPFDKPKALAPRPGAGPSMGKPKKPLPAPALAGKAKAAANKAAAGSKAGYVHTPGVIDHPKAYMKRHPGANIVMQKDGTATHGPKKGRVTKVTKSPGGMKIKRVSAGRPVKRPMPLNGRKTKPKRPTV